MNQYHPLFPVYVLILCGLLALSSNLPAQPSPTALPTPDFVELNGFVQDNLVIPIENYAEALISISNKQVVIDGYWEFKDETGQVLQQPIILSQPGDLTNKLLIALRRPGRSEVRVTENGKETVYAIRVDARFEENNIEKELESAIVSFVNDPGLKVQVLPPQAALVGANLNRAFGEETASEIMAPRGEAAGNATSDIAIAEDFRPTIILSGEVKNDLVMAKAESIARAYTSNVVNLLSVANPLQLRINIKVIQATLNKDTNIGIQHRGAATDVDGLAIRDGLGMIFNSTAPFFETGAANILPIFGNLEGGSTTYRTQVNLRDLGVDFKVLQEPTLTVLNGQAAEFLVGQEISVPIGFTIDNGVVTQQFAQRQIGVSLRITPIVEEEEMFRPDADTGGIPVSSISAQQSRRERGEDGNNIDHLSSIDENGIVRLFVQPSITALQGFDRNGFAQINTNRLETRVAMKHGESLVIGGLFDDSMRKTMEKTPFLSDIPILGELFKNRINGGRRNELIFVLTPEVLGIDQVNQKGNIKGRLQNVNKMLFDEGLQTKPTRISANDVFVREADAVQFISTGAGQPIRIEASDYNEVLQGSSEQMQNSDQNDSTAPAFQQSEIELTPRPTEQE